MHLFYELTSINLLAKKTAWIAALFLYPLLSTAAVYKWTDSEGNIIYSDVPPPVGAEIERIKEPSKPSIDQNKAREAAREQAEAFSKRREKRLEDEQKTKEETQAKKQQQQECDMLRDRLSKFTTFNRVRVQNADGEYEAIGEEQRQEEIKKLESLISERCS